MSNEPVIKKSIDLAGVVCPLNFVKTKAALYDLASGDVLEVVLDEGDAILNVPRSLKDEGHGILKVTPLDDGTKFRVLVKKA